MQSNFSSLGIALTQPWLSGFNVFPLERVFKLRFTSALPDLGYAARKNPKIAFRFQMVSGQRVILWWRPGAFVLHWRLWFRRSV